MAKWPNFRSKINLTKSQICPLMALSSPLHEVGLSKLERSWACFEQHNSRHDEFSKYAFILENSDNNFHTVPKM